MAGWADRRRCCAWSAAQRQGSEPGERAGEVDGPWPRALQPQDRAAGVVDDPRGNVQQPVAQRLGFGQGERAVQQQCLGPAQEVLGAQDQLEPDGVAAQEVEREVGQAGGFGGADAVFDAGALAVAQLQPGQVRVVLVGEEDLEAVAVMVGEAQLRAGVGVLAAADRAGARRPVAKVDPAGQLAHLGALADLPVGVDRRGPGLLGLGAGRLAHMLVDRHSEREPDLVVAQVPGEPGAGAGAVASHQDRLLADRGKLGEGEVGQLDQVSSAAGGGVAWPQQARERLTRGLAAVQVGQQRVEPEGVLVGARRAFLVVAVGEHQGRVGVDDQQLDIWTAADSPRAGTGMRPGGSQSPDPLGRIRLAVGPADQRDHAVTGDRRLPAQHAKDVGALGQKPAPLHGSHLHKGTRSAANTAAAGKVVTQASRILPTTSQPTCRYRRRPTPTPTTEEETTWVVLAGAPTSEADRITAAELAWLTRPSTGRMRKMRRPMVLTIRHPPSAVPTVSAMAQARVAHTGADSDWIVPLATSSTPTPPPPSGRRWRRG